MTGRVQRVAPAAQLAITNGAKQGLTAALLEIQSTAVALAPIRDGYLRSSATVTTPTGGDISGRVSFPMVYARVQHEREDFNHPRGGQAKYLATAVEMTLGRAKAQIRDAIRRNL